LAKQKISERENKTKIAYKIVEFWHTIEFLNQESFPQDTKENRRKVGLAIKEQQGRITKEECKFSKITLFYNLPLSLEVSELVRYDDIFYLKYPKCGSSLHLCIGKIKREVLIRKLYESLKIKDDRPEDDNGKICLIGLKVDKEGFYIEKSFRISPLVWGIYKCIISGGKIDGIVTSRKYENDIKELEETISKIEPLRSTQIADLYNSVLNKYVKSIDEELIGSELEGSFIYTRYDSEKTFEREDEKEEDISELVKGFYVDDLEMVKQALENSNGNSSSYSHIVDYIIGAYEESKDYKPICRPNRIDIRNSKLHIEEWLFVDKSPSGKWPSKFNPALMQQVAINMGISDTNQIGKIFSVNGPPGTGKKTLLKEIIASNIVERAKIMCEYENSDDAFEPRFFENGDYINNGYDKYCNKYYTFRDEKLSDFSMLVAS